MDILTMTTPHDEPRMLRKQYHLSAAHVRRVETLRAELGLGSDAEVIRRAIDTFDPDALDTKERELVEATAEDLRIRIERLNLDIAETIERAEATRDQLNDPTWIESIRERTRQEAAANPSLIYGVADLIGAVS